MTGDNPRAAVAAGWLASRLSPQELAAAATQGFVARERLPSGQDCYKLRFRLSGRQRVKYLGCQPHLADAVARELADWQEAHRRRRQLRRIVHQMAALLREHTRRLEPLAEAAGWRRHGRTFRQRRTAPPGGQPTLEIFPHGTDAVPSNPGDIDGRTCS